MPLLYNRIQFWAAGALGSAAVGGLRRAWRMRLVQQEGWLDQIRSGRRQVLGTFWHRHLLAMLCACRGWPFCAPVSEHRDGEYVAQVMERCGFLAVRGSSTRGSIRLLRNLVLACKDGWSCAITPDGPQGPRYSVKPGFAMLARRLALPVLPVGVAVDRAWELGSWDGFLIPKPLARVCLFVAEPLPAEAAEKLGHDALCSRLKEAMNAANRRAQMELDKWAGRGCEPSEA